MVSGFEFAVPAEVVPIILPSLTMYWVPGFSSTGVPPPAGWNMTGLPGSSWVMSSAVDSWPYPYAYAARLLPSANGFSGSTGASELMLYSYATSNTLTDPGRLVGVGSADVRRSGANGA